MSAQVSVETRIAELLEVSQTTGLTPELAGELAELYRKQEETRTQVQRALRASGMKFPNEKDNAALIGVVAAAHFLFNLERMYTRVKMANATNDYNDIAERYGYPFCTKPGDLLAHLEKHIPAGTWLAGVEKYRTGQGAKYGDWKRGIRGLAAVEAAITSGKVYRVKDND